MTIDTTSIDLLYYYQFLYFPQRHMISTNLMLYCRRHSLCALIVASCPVTSTVPPLSSSVLHTNWPHPVLHALLFLSIVGRIADTTSQPVYLLLEIVPLEHVLCQRLVGQLYSFQIGSLP